MLTFVNTSILESNVQTVTNTVNTVGVMGKGLAAEFKARSPDMYKQYRQLCDKNLFNVGQLWLWKKEPQWILNFPTKQHWKNPSRIEYIEAGLIKFVAKYEEHGIREISFPRLGCGNGGLDWSEVRPLMEKHLGKLPILVLIHDFEKDIGSIEHKLSPQSPDVNLSFESFLRDIKALAIEKDNRFHTITTNNAFEIQVESDDSIFINLLGKSQRQRVLRDDLFEAWQMLIHGYLTINRLVGSCRPVASYVLALFATLPYTRPILLRKNSSDAPTTLAVELFDDQVATELLTQASRDTKKQVALWA